MIRPPRSIRLKENPNHQDKPIDKFSLGHVAFGLNFAAVYLVLTYSIAPTSQYPSIAFNFFIILAFIIPPFIFIFWELLEHDVLRKKVYVEQMGMRGWRESAANSIMDVVVAVIAFEAYYVPVVYLVDGMPVIVFFIVIPFAVTPVLAYIALKKK